VPLFDQKGHAIGGRNYDADGRLQAEDWTLPNGDDESTIYDGDGHAVSDVKTRVADSQTRFDRWSYDAEGHLVWHLAVNGDGELLSNWYKVGYEPKLSSSDSLGICRPRLGRFGDSQSAIALGSATTRESIAASKLTLEFGVGRRREILT
jgi:hypothetical protein